MRRVFARGVLALALAGCGPRAPRSSPAAPPVDAATRRDAGAQTTVATETAIALAEASRRPGDVDEAWLASSDVRVRRLAVRAMARIASAPIGTEEEAALLRGLGDEDLEVVAWAAYGLGWACKGKEDLHVKALTARLATLEESDAGVPSGRGSVDSIGSIARAIGRCGGPLAEGVLVGLLRVTADDSRAEEAEAALGAVAGRRPLADETVGVLVDRAGQDPERADGAAALYALGRLDRIDAAWAPRVATAARAVLAAAKRTSTTANFAVRALEKTGAASDLARAIARGDELAPATRAEAARALGRMGVPGREAAAVALRDAAAPSALDAASLEGDSFNVLEALLDAFNGEAPKSADGPLKRLAEWPIPPNAAPSLARRVVDLRCAAAAALARSNPELPSLIACDPDPSSAAAEHARLLVLLRRPLLGEHRKAFRALAASAHLKVREDALEAIPVHPELDDTGRALLVEALGATEPGLVATAAEAITQHPDRVLTLAASERRAALDPRAPPPTTHPAMDLPAEVNAALARALAKPWREDAVETRTALLDAAVAVSSPEARPAAARACTDPNVTLRDHAARALRALGAPDAACPAPAATGKTREGLPVATRGARVTFDIAGKRLTIAFEPSLSPIAVARFVALAKTGFYKGIVVHRVVPGYVVQFGDPGGDGYGGSGHLLPCETSPVPFDAMDVGVALAGRDTGSSQLFVALGRYPKLDGDYARVGRAEGDWDAVAAGDVVEGVTVEE
jgi:cyclophilin family peptidyl-prolyl cis-trans isomerase